MDNVTITKLLFLISKITNSNIEKIIQEPEYECYYNAENESFYEVREIILKIFSIDKKTSDDDISKLINKRFITKSMCKKLDVLKYNPAYIKLVCLYSLGNIKKELSIELNLILENCYFKSEEDIRFEFEEIENDIKLQGLRNEISQTQCYNQLDMLRDIKNYAISIVRGEQIPKITNSEWEELFNEDIERS